MRCNRIARGNGAVIACRALSRPAHAGASRPVGILDAVSSPDMIALHDLRRLHEPYRNELRQALEEVLDSGWFVLGDRVRAFEAAFAAACGARRALGVASGTDALEIALRAAGVGNGDSVATVANAGGYATCAILACGATPAYVDVDGDSMQVDVESLAAALARRPRAVVVTHLYGRLAPIEHVVPLCADVGATLIEDCAQAYGALRRGRRAGTFGALGCYSFYPTKNLGALGDGGAIVTSDEGLAARVEALRQYGWHAKYRATERGGRNSRLDALQAAVLLVKLRYAPREVARRRAIGAIYRAQIAHPSIVAPVRGGDDDAMHLYVIRTQSRDALAAHLTTQGVQTDIHYPVPDHHQPAYAAPSPIELPVTERLAREVLTLPCHPGMTDEEVLHVVAACNGFRG
jgi:dTDP-3-amino-2,3,6-trideoxy-4-keto-D-glucose/dTDP-3-amino-3,4,6-trideoxy-alpha-D-glucose/dTDP-2,6-dideoxy-D-kanosamine transaminase